MVVGVGGFKPLGGLGGGLIDLPLISQARQNLPKCLKRIPGVLIKPANQV